METLSWPVLAKYLDQNSPALLDVGGGRGLQIGFDPKESRLFMRVALRSVGQVPPSPFAEIALEERRVRSQRVIEIATTSKRLFPEFHRLAGLYAEELEKTSDTEVETLLRVAARWRELVASRSVLSPEAQLGLLGEMALLKSLVQKLGPAAVFAWTANVAELPERHDFRLDGVDMEVKTTRSTDRQHVIHGLTQLSPSVGHSLFLVSLRFEAAGVGSGSSLAERVEGIRKAIEVDGRAKATFEERLLKANYRDQDAAYYRERLILADVPMLIPVDAVFPKIVRPLLEAVLGKANAARIARDVTYRINVEGLGRDLADVSNELPFGPLSVE